MWGGIFGLSYVSQDRWGGLPVTLILATFGLAFGFPLGILVALGRRSKLPAIRSLCVLYVELIRGVPLISLLFMASVMFPLFMPDGVNIDKLLRAQIAFVLYAGAYLAEVVRGGLQAVPRGQHEAADALGLSYWKKNGLIILPQAIRHVIPPLVNTFIAFFKDTSLVLIIGIFDLLDHGEDRDHRSRLAVVQRRGVPVRRADLFRLLLCHVTLQPAVSKRRRGRRDGCLRKTRLWIFPSSRVPEAIVPGQPHSLHRTAMLWSNRSEGWGRNAVDQT